MFDTSLIITLQAHLQPHPGIEQEDKTLRYLKIMIIMITMVMMMVMMTNQLIKYSCIKNEVGIAWLIWHRSFFLLSQSTMTNEDRMIIIIIMINHYNNDSPAPNYLGTSRVRKISPTQQTRGQNPTSFILRWRMIMNKMITTMINIMIITTAMMVIMMILIIE